jgi:TRAP-type C4-dicarboxylate transport system permease small subunit
MTLRKAYDALYRVFSPITRYLFYIGLCCLAIMMFLTAVDVIGRYFFNRPVLGSFEITEYLMVILVGASLAYCGIKKGHVEIELLTDRLSMRAQTILGCVTSFLGFLLFCLITWQTVLYVGDLLESGLESSVLHIPAWPFVVALAIGSAVFCLVLFLRFLEYLYRAFSNDQL